MKLRNVTFANWLASHGAKDAEERWLRELYPWPVLAQVEYDESHRGRPQAIIHDEVEYTVTLLSVRWQPARGTFRYRVRVDSEGLGWHARSFADDYDVCASPDGTFVTLFHAKSEEPLEKIARAFFGRRWDRLPTGTLNTLAVSRFLAACLVSRLAEEAFAPAPLEHYPEARLVGSAPMFAQGEALWIGYRFFSENAYAWARRNADKARRVVAVYLADTKYQFRTDLPPGAEVRSASELDGQLLANRHEDFIRMLLRRLDTSMPELDLDTLKAVLSGSAEAPATVAISEGDVHEALAALKTPCRSKDDLRYQLAAAVVLNAWIESESRLGYPQRKRFYAFKQQVDELARWALASADNNIAVWRENSSIPNSPILFVRVDNVDFSFHAIPLARELPDGGGQLAWSGVRLKPIAPLVLAWAREIRASPCAAQR
jgi:hypothetical protein